MLDNVSASSSDGAAPDEAAARHDAAPASVAEAETKAARKAEPAGQIVEYDAAVKRRAASFNQLAAAVVYSRPRFTPDPYERTVYAKYIAPLTDAFEAAHGHITHSFYCERTIAAAVLTDRNEFYLVYSTIDAQDVGIADMLLECDRLNVESSRLLAGAGRGDDLKTTKILIYAVVTRLLSLLDARALPPRAILDLHRREADNVQNHYLRAAIRQAKIDYFLGMLIGGLLSVATISLGAPVLTQYASSLGIAGPTLVGRLAAGGVGAVISVMSRMTFDELTLDYEAGRLILIILGAFRPVIGMVLGAAVWVLAGAMAIGPSGKEQLPFFYLLIAFLAGFSERWAQDMLGHAADQIGGRAGGRASSPARGSAKGPAKGKAKRNEESK